MRAQGSAAGSGREKDGRPLTTCKPLRVLSDTLQRASNTAMTSHHEQTCMLRAPYGHDPSHTVPRLSCHRPPCHSLPPSAPSVESPPGLWQCWGAALEATETACAETPQGRHVTTPASRCKAGFGRTNRQQSATRWMDRQAKTNKQTDRQTETDRRAHEQTKPTLSSSDDTTPH